MNQSDDSYKQKILKWLDSQGYPLEIEVAQMFEKHGFNISISDYYQDYESGDYREIDVTASRSSDYKFDSILRVFWRVECKTSKDKPWVVFLSNSNDLNAIHIPPIGLITTDEYENYLVGKHVMPKFGSIIDELDILNPIKSGHGLRRVFIKEKESKEDSDSGQDVAYKAMMSSVKASFAKVLNPPKQDEELLAKNFISKKNYWTIALPNIVIEGKLFEYSKDSSGNVQLEEVEYSVVKWKGNNPINATPYVYVVTKDALEKFVEKAKKITDVLIEIAESSA